MYFKIVFIGRFILLAFGMRGICRGGFNTIGLCFGSYYRVYFAFKPGPDVGEQMVSVGGSFRAKHGLKGRVSQYVLHMTLCPIGYFPDMPMERAEAACKIASGLVSKPFEIILDRVGTYNTQKKKLPLAAFAADGLPKAELFRRTLMKDLRLAGFVFDKRPPNLHATLLYDECIVPIEPIEPIHWTVRDFALVHSVSGEGRHILLGQWPLSG